MTTAIVKKKTKRRHELHVGVYVRFFSSTVIVFASYAHGIIEKKLQLQSWHKMFSIFCNGRKRCTCNDTNKKAWYC